MSRFFIIIMFLATTGCSTLDVTQYKTNQPKLDLFQYFQGTTRGWGIVQNRKGTLAEQFVVTIEGSLDADGHLVLDEKFVWSDQEKSSRKWTIKKIDGHHYSGEAGDVVGTAKGVSYGNVLNWRYDLNLEVDGRVLKIHFNDWMFLQPDDVLINKASMSKFGLNVGEVTIVFRKE